ncbi:MAG: hypothetical protein KTR14_02915 [Vampirovibrio sp.]|nr:hypothetical protein [Vampirovibrio sp.]
MRKMSAKRLYFFSKGRLFALTLMALLLSTSLLLGCAAPFMETAEASGKLGTLPYNPDTHEVTLPAPLLKHPFRFVAIGDTGSEASFQYDVAKEMARQHQKQPFAAVLMLGDLIYPDGNVHKHGDKAFLKPNGP